jgi:hypothetical protein
MPVYNDRFDRSRRRHDACEPIALLHSPHRRVPIQSVRFVDQ